MESSRPTRFLALDVLRGLTVAFMIIVNTPGSWDHVYAPLLHADWHGFTPTDLVFPTFLFAVGNALAFTLPALAQRGQREFLRKTLQRSMLLIAIGILLYWLPFFKRDAAGLWQVIGFADTRLPGVLQRIGLCFALASLILYYGKQVLAYWFCVLALLAYWLILVEFGDLSMAGNAARQFDLWLLGPSHLYRGEGMAFDPEGLLGTLPATVNVLAGYFAGKHLRTAAQSSVNQAAALTQLLRQFAKLGVALVLLAMLWDAYFPINKKLWTSSYVLLCIGLDLLLLAVLTLITDIWQWRRWTWCFTLFGRNTLLIYLFSQLFVIVLIHLRIGAANAYDCLYQQVFRPPLGALHGSFAFAIFCLFCCLMLAWWMDRRKLYIRL